LDVGRSQELLEQVFPKDRRYRDLAYLRWQYMHGPSGLAITADRDDPSGRVGHYAIVPQRWICSGEPALFALSLNTAVAERARGQGLFTVLAKETYKGAADQGVEAVVGVANGNSTPGFVRHLGFRNLGPLPVVILPARPTRKNPTVINSDQLLSDSIFMSQDGHLDSRRYWDTDELRWRLNAPNEAFVVVRSEDALVVACSTKVAGIKFAVILKVFAEPSSAPVDAGAVVAQVCRAVHAPFAVYAGFNPHFQLSGIPVPMRFRTSPLNLILRSVNDARNVEEFLPNCFEFLDFDAY